MRWHCDECGCEFWHYLSCPTEIVKCPQCKSTNIRIINSTANDYSDTH